MPKRRTAAQRAASVSNLAKARAARRARFQGTPKGKLASHVPLKRTRVVLRKGQLFRATTNFRGLTVIHHPALTGSKLKGLTMKHRKK